MKHPDILTLIDDKLDQKIRNVKIRTIWDVMKRWTEVNYTARIQHLMDEFHLSYQHIERLLRMRKNSGEDSLITQEWVESKSSTDTRLEIRCLQHCDHKGPQFKHPLLQSSINHSILNLNFGLTLI